MPESGWDAPDFLLAGAMLTTVAVLFTVAVRRSASRPYRWAVAVALAAAFVLVWANAAVGIIGSEDNAANRMYLALPAVMAIGALLSRLRAGGMAWTMLAATLVQVLVAVIAVVTGLAPPGARAVLELGGITSFFCVPWLLCAWLFRRAARTSGR